MQSQKYLPFTFILIAALVFFLLFTFAARPGTTSLQTLPTPSASFPSPSRQVLEAQAKPTTDPAANTPVVRVVDGDTIIVSLDGKRETVRLIGINTPETVDPRKAVQCFGKEASAHAKTVLTNTEVRLEADPTQDNRDKYGRLLRYVFLPDGTNFNELMIEEGYAYEYTYDIPYQYQKEFKIAQEAAEKAGKGLWNEATCNGKL